MTIFQRCSALSPFLLDVPGAHCFCKGDILLMQLVPRWGCTVEVSFFVAQKEKPKTKNSYILLIYVVTIGEKEQPILKLQTHSESKYFSDNSPLLVGRWLEYKRMWFRFLHQHKHFSIYMYKFCRYLLAWKYNSTFILQNWGVFCTIHIVQWSQHPSDIPNWNEIEIMKTKTTVCLPFPKALHWQLQIRALKKKSLM